MQVSQDPEIFDLRFQHPATHYVSGPSTCGKTVRVCKLIRHKNIIFQGGKDIKNIIVFYDSWQDEYEKLKKDCNINKFINKMPTTQEFVQLTKPFKDKGGSIIVIDDMLSKMNEDLDHIFRVAGRHNNASVFVLFQSLFPPHKLARQISLNSKYFHLHRNPRESGQINHFARQVKPTNVKFVSEVFHDATKKPYGSLLVDVTQECDERLRFRANYLPEEGPTIAYDEK